MLPEKWNKGLIKTWKLFSFYRMHWELPFLEAYVENAENLIDDYQVRVVDGVPTKRQRNGSQLFMKS